MALDTKHPQYIRFAPDWNKLNDAYQGERKVKDEGEEYLKPTAGMVADGMKAGQPGRAAYDAYRERARFPDLIRTAVTALVGVMHNKPPVIELPASMEDMRDNATINNESLEMLLRRINEEQLKTGRLGLLLDVPDNAPVGVMPYIAMYMAQHVLNWDDGTRQELVRQNLNLVVMDESEFERKEDFEWEYEEKYRVAVLGDPDANEGANENAVYRVGVFTDRGGSFNESALVEPAIGGRKLNEIPFVFINAQDVVPRPDIPPLLGLGDLAFTIYRGEADYRQGLFMQSQDTLVVLGETDPDRVYRTGANASINLPAEGDAKFIGVESTGLEEQRLALENDRKEASQRSGELLDSTARQREAEGALRIRVAARTATLNRVAMAGAFGLETILKTAAVWVGANPDEVSVEPNLDFVDDEMTGKDLVELATAKTLGVPLSLESIHRLMAQKDMTEMEFEEELEKIANEEPLTGSTNEDGPELEDEEEVPPTEEPEE